jgi:hypothetical protein
MAKSVTKAVKAGTGLVKTGNTFSVSYGSTSTTAAAGNDSRLSDSRAPSGSAGGDLTGTYPNPTIGSGKVTSTHILDGTIVNADINASAAIALSKLATDPLARANHTGSQTASTISDFTSSAQAAISAGSGITYSAGVVSLASGTGGAGLTFASGVLAVGAGTGISVAADAISVSYGTTSTTAAVGNDSRLSDSRAPSGSAGGDLTGTYPNPSIASGVIVNADISASAAIGLSKLATDPLARANHTGTQTASTISDFDTQVRTSRLDQLAAPIAAISMGSQKVANVGTPSATTDAANKTYVDTAVGVVSATAAAAPTRALVLFFA